MSTIFLTPRDREYIIRHNAVVDALLRAWRTHHLEPWLEVLMTDAVSPLTPRTPATIQLVADIRTLLLSFAEIGSAVLPPEAHRAIAFFANHAEQSYIPEPVLRGARPKPDEASAARAFEERRRDKRFRAIVAEQTRLHLLSQHRAATRIGPNLASGTDTRISRADGHRKSLPPMLAEEVIDAATDGDDEDGYTAREFEANGHFFDVNQRRR